MFNMFKYACSHMKGVLAIFLIIIFFLTSFIYETRSQLKSAANGIEILMVDSSLSLGNADKLASSIKKSTGVKYVGVAELLSSDAQKYIDTINNYPMYEYLKYLTLSRDSELIIVPGSMLETVFLMNNIVPLELGDSLGESDGSFPENALLNGVPYALPLKNISVTDYDATVSCIQDEPYAVLVGGDHVEVMRSYLSSLLNISEEKNV